jgi:hypothetical protein
MSHFQVRHRQRDERLSQWLVSPVWSAHRCLEPGHHLPREPLQAGRHLLGSHTRRDIPGDDVGEALQAARSGLGSGIGNEHVCDGIRNRPVWRPLYFLRRKAS